MHYEGGGGESKCEKGNLIKIGNLIQPNLFKETIPYKMSPRDQNKNSVDKSKTIFAQNFHSLIIKIA